MDSQGIIWVFSTIFLCLLLHFPFEIEATSRNELLNDVCHQSPDDKSCIKALKSDPKISRVSNLKGLTNVALGEAREESIATKKFFISLKDSSDPKVKKALKECAKYFGEAKSMLNLDGLEGDTASLDVHYALDSCEQCENALKEANVHIGAIAPHIKRWKDSYNVAYAAVVATENSETIT
ncbi:hypothetical protein JCGZ_08347 [Jatropha curcas]|uniref:Pectinesterase inhibitor domain-containing protein n=1 Tax=Jatropha curcas TaxID=180498 RepID=A0A067KWD4_JATCU|nr:pectinesterase inhibitor [Jatropha curcas]KDP36580.1 hypothetical protein JCGZ_08347 [Jatropha curcas]